MSLLDPLLSKMLLPSPLQTLPLPQNSDYQLFIKRDDLIHTDISGNKWRKLKYNMLHYLEGDYDEIVSVGGPFSNHIYALAAVSHLLDLPCTGLIRGNSVNANNPTLSQCVQWGMKLIAVPPDQYAHRTNYQLLSDLSGVQHPFIIPEGGSNKYSEQGCQEILDELGFEPDYIVLPLGTGGTAAGLISKQAKTKIICISPFKKDKIDIPYLEVITGDHSVKYDYALSGYGRYNARMVRYINDFWEKYEIPLDPVYNAKAMMGLEDLLAQQYFKKGSSIVYLHTGGLQGVKGFNMIHGTKQMITF